MHSVAQQRACGVDRRSGRGSGGQPLLFLLLELSCLVQGWIRRGSRERLAVRLHHWWQPWLLPLHPQRTLSHF